MYQPPVVGDTFIDIEQRKFNLAYYDELQALLNPDPMLGSETGLHLTQDDFRSKIDSGELRPAYAITHENNELTASQKKELKKREPYITELATLVHDGYKPTVDETIDKLKQIVHDKYHIGTEKHGNSTIARWWKQYREAEFNLKKSIAPRKSQPKRTNTATENFLNRFFTDTWVKGNIENIVRGYSSYSKAALKAQTQNDAIEQVSERTFSRRIEGLNAFNIILNSGNYSEVKKALRTLSKKIKTTHVLERVEMDRMSLNLALIDEEGKPTGNVSIYIAIDCHSRYPLSVTFELGTSEDTEGVVRSFKRIFESTSDQLNACGIPFKIIVDNGSGYKAEQFKQITQRLGCELIKAPSNEPWRKPFVESFNNTLREEFFKGGEFKLPDGTITIGLPGYKDKRTHKTSKPSSEETIKKAASLPVEEFASLLHDYLVHYVNSKHSSLNNKTPQQVWNESVALKPLIPVNKELLSAACHYIEHNPSLSQRGTVQVNKQVFADDRIKQCYLDAKTLDKNQDMTVTVKSDPDDGRWVTVIADFPCYDHPKVFDFVENRKLSGSELEYPLSFEELNTTSGTPERRDIFSRKITKLVKQKTRSLGSGKPVATAKENLSKGLSTAERIERSNQSYAYKPIKKSKKSIEDNTPSDKGNIKRKVSPNRNEAQLGLWQD